MRMQQHPLRGALLRRTAPVLGAGAGWLTLAILRAMRLTNRRRSADFWAGFMRRLGPRLPEHRIGRDNLVAAFPDKSPAEIEQIPAGVLGQSRPLCGGVRADRPVDQRRSEPAG